MRFSLWLLLATALVIVPGRALGAGTARLVYLRGHGTETCPDEQALRDAVAARLGYDAFTPWALDTLFTELEKDGAAYVARVKLVAPDNAVRGARTLKTTGNCADLVPTLGLTISLAIDPLALSRKGPPEGLPPTERPVVPLETAPEPAPPAPHESSAADEPAATTDEKVTPVFAAGAGPIASVGSAPAPALGALVFGRVRIRDLSAALEARGDLPASGEAETAGRVSSWLLGGSFLVCVHRGGFYACPRATLGRLSARGLEVKQPGESAALWAEVGGRLGYELALGGSYSVRLGIEAASILTRYRLRLDGGEVFEHPPFSAGVSAAIVTSFR